MVKGVASGLHLTEEEKLRQLEAQMEAERQKRRAYHANGREAHWKNSTRGWQCWYDLYWEKTREKNLFKAAAQR